MNITLRQMDAGSLRQVDQFQRNSIVNSKLVLRIKEGRLTYSIVPVEPYEKILNVDPEDYTTFIDNPQKVIFFADVDGQPVGQIKMVPWWNKFTYLDLRKNQKSRVFIRHILDFVTTDGYIWGIKLPSA